MDNLKDNNLHEADSIDNLLKEDYNKGIAKMQEAHKAQDIDLYIDCLSIFCMLTALEPHYLDCDFQIEQCKKNMLKLRTDLDDIF